MRTQCLPTMRRLQLLVCAPLAALMIFCDNEFKILVEYVGISYTENTITLFEKKCRSRICYVNETSV